MIKVDENDPVGELQPSFPYRDVAIKRNVDMKEYYELETEIGRGKFGTVYRCKEKSTGLTLAAKFVGIARRQDRRNVEREVEIMRTLQHPRLIQLYDAFESSNVMCVIQELIEGGELFERVIDDDFILTEKACTVFMRQICEGVEFIHSQNILHLDLKPENILCLTKTGNRIKIIDFGLARKFEPDKKLQVLFGTPEFVAPEVVNFEQIGFGTDMWSVGVICYVLLSGLSPFMGETDVETMANVTISQYDFDDDAFDDISDDAKDFISKLLTKNKEQRLTATECLSHVWLRRKLPPPAPPPASSTPLLQNIQLPNTKSTINNSILDNTKENLREFVDRWSEQGGNSPTKIISVQPINEPFKQISNNVQPLVNDDKNNNSVNKQNTSKTPVKMDVDEINKPLPKSPENLNKFDNVTKDATQSDNTNSIIENPGKKLKLEIPVPLGNSVIPSNQTDNNDNNIVKNLSPEISIPSPNQSNISLPSPNQSNVSSPTPNQSNVSLPSPNQSNISLPSPNQSKISSPTPNLSNVSLPSPNQSNVSSPTPNPSNVSLPSPNQSNVLPNPVISPIKSTPTSPIGGTIPKTPSNSKLQLNANNNVIIGDTNNKPLPSSPIKNSPSSPIKQLPVQISNGTIPKPNDKINLSNGTLNVTNDTKGETNILSNNLILSNDSVDKKDLSSTGITKDKLSESTYKSSVINPVVTNVQQEKDDIIRKPPQFPGTNQKQSKLVPQFSVPNDLNKCTLNKRVPISTPLDSIIKQREIINANKNIKVNKLINDNINPVLRTEKNLTDIKTNEPSNSTNVKFNKPLNNVQPKIHGIVLGQSNDENNDSSSLNNVKGPKVITHKIFVEGRTDPVSPSPPGSIATSINLNNDNIKKNDNRVPKPIGKSQTSSKLELKQNSVNNDVKIKPNIGLNFLENDRLDRRGSDISCFLHNTENMERTNLADEIKKLSFRLFQMGNNSSSDTTPTDDSDNDFIKCQIPASTYRNDPIGRFLANHGVVTRRPKFRVSYLNRDVPIGSPPPPSNLFYHLSHSNSDNWSDNQTHSAPQSPSISPEREPASLTKEVIYRLFDKPQPTTPSPISSIDSLASYFKSNNGTNKKSIPTTLTSK